MSPREKLLLEIYEKSKNHGLGLQNCLRALRALEMLVNPPFGVGVWRQHGPEVVVVLNQEHFAEALRILRGEE